MRATLASRAPQAALRWLRHLLSHDEQTRPRPAITLPRLAGAEAAPYGPMIVEAPPGPIMPATPAASTVMPVSVIMAAAAAADFLGRRQRGRARPLAADLVVYLVRTMRGRTIAATAIELAISESTVWTVCSRVRHLRLVDPDIDRALHAIEAELRGATPET